MKSHLLYLFTRTPLHVGAGASVGAIDQPIQRERHTGFPIIPGSSIKGVMRDHFFGMGEETVRSVFGYSDNDDSRSGSITFSEAKLLAFPLRSAKGCYAMAVCPLTLQRYARNQGLDLPIPEEPTDSNCLAGASIAINEKAVVLEEYQFKINGGFPDQWASHLSALLNDEVLNGAEKRWVLLSNGDFSHFAVNACQVSQHVGIDENTGTQKDGALFNEETVPSETLFFAVLNELRFESAKEEILSTVTT